MTDIIDILRKEGENLPRYTSYPTAPHFSETEGTPTHQATMADLSAEKPLSVYLHIPFCDRLCWFCGCHTKQTLSYAPIADYVRHLVMEIEAFGATAGVRPPAAFIHFGGGSPSMLSERDGAAIRAALEKTFELSAETEISLEIDPGDMREGGIASLDTLGVTRASIGVQDFDEKVQKAINRPQSFEDTRRVVELIREHGINSLNIDALYGLPYQTRASIVRTMDQVLSLEPDRIALFGYAHVPWMKKHQRLIPEAALPGLDERLAQAGIAGHWLEERGYQPIGIDHYARPGDSLATAANRGKLRRNFQGYTTDSCDTLIGFGASAISRSPAGYVQNTVATNLYMRAIAEGRPAVAKGFRLSADDEVRSFIIERLMCDFRLDFTALREAFGDAAEPYIGEAMRIAASDPYGLSEIYGDSFLITPFGKPLTRLVASRFDAYRSQRDVRFSKAI